MKNHFKINNNAENLQKAHRNAILTGMRKIADCSKENTSHQLLADSKKFKNYSKLATNLKGHEDKKNMYSEQSKNYQKHTIYVIGYEHQSKGEIGSIKHGLFPNPRLSEKKQTLDEFILSVRDNLHLNSKFKYFFNRQGVRVENIDQIRNFDKIFILGKNHFY